MSDFNDFRRDMEIKLHAKRRAKMWRFGEMAAELLDVGDRVYAAEKHPACPPDEKDAAMFVGGYRYVIDKRWPSGRIPVTWGGIIKQ